MLRPRVLLHFLLLANRLALALPASLLALALALETTLAGPLGSVLALAVGLLALMPVGVGPRVPSLPRQLPDVQEPTLEVLMLGVVRAPVRKALAAEVVVGAGA